MGEPGRSSTTTLDVAIVALRVVATLGTILAALAAYWGWDRPSDGAPRAVMFWGAACAAVAVLIVWFLEERRRSNLEGAKSTVDELLRAEQIRVLTITNGAFLPTLAALQGLVAMTDSERQREISGFRQAVVERACDLVKNESPRAAYPRVEALDARVRVMRPRPYISQRARVDEFTSEFREDDGVQPDVWRLIDAADTAALRREVNLPGKVYHSYVSAPVRSGGIAFGMLTLNVLEAGGLSTEDRDFILVLARLLAVAESIALSPDQREAYRRMSAARSRLER